jgi:neutral ceramidase
MGYAKSGQNTKGIHIRQYSRAFIFEDVDNYSKSVFVSVDCGMMGQLVKNEVPKNRRCPKSQQVQSVECQT